MFNQIVMKTGFVGILCIIAVAVSGSAQVISFNSPTPWLTLRNDSIIVKAQLDTSKFPKKTVAMSVEKIENKKKIKMTSKTFKIKDFTQDFSFGLAKANLFGGQNFLRINWNIPGAKDSGYCAPVGIVNIDKIAKTEPVHATKAGEEISATNVSGIAAGKKFTKVQDREFAVVWTEKGLSIICKKAAAAQQGSAAVRFVFDGKNGKNAFVAFSDKMIDYIPGKDSLHTFSNERFFSGDSISYKEKQWIQEIGKVSDKDYFVMQIPWYDLGMGKPFENRTMGFSAFALSDKSAVMAAYPEKASVFIPGSWGNLILDK